MSDLPRSMRIRVIHEGAVHEDIYDVESVEITTDVEVEISHYRTLILRPAAVPADTDTA